MTKQEFIEDYLQYDWGGKDKYFWKCIEYWLLLPDDIPLNIPYYSNSKQLLERLKSKLPLANLYYDAIINSSRKGKVFCEFMQKLKECNFEDEKQMDKNISSH